MVDDRTSIVAWLNRQAEKRQHDIGAFTVRLGWTSVASMGDVLRELAVAIEQKQDLRQPIKRRRITLRRRLMG